MTLYQTLKDAGIPLSSHASDLYFPVTQQTREILQRFPLEHSNATVFTNQVEGGRWFDVPFAFIPYWESKEAK